MSYQKVPPSTRVLVLAEYQMCAKCSFRLILGVWLSRGCCPLMREGTGTYVEYIHVVCRSVGLLNDPWHIFLQLSPTQVDQ